MTEEFAEFARRHEATMRTHEGPGHPELTDFPLSEVTGAVPEAMMFLRYSATAFSAAEFWHTMAWNCEYLGCTFTDSVLVKGKVWESTFAETTFVGCNLARAEAARSTLRDVRFVSCDLRYVDFSSCSFENVTFERCVFDRTTFQTATLASVTFVEPDFAGPVLFAEGEYIQAVAKE